MTAPPINHCDMGGLAVLSPGKMTARFRDIDVVLPVGDAIVIIPPEPVLLKRGKRQDG